MKFNTEVLFQSLSRKFQVSLKSDKHFTWRPIYVIDHISLSSSWMRNVSDESFRENQNTHFVFSDFFPENRAVYKIMWKYLVQSDRPQMTKTRRLQSATVVRKM
jgi:hypothetical protein